MTADAQRERERFARNLSSLLAACGKTQSDLAADLGLTPSTVSDWATAKKYPRVDKLTRLAAYFGVPLARLREDPQENAVQRIPVVGTVVAGIPTQAVQNVIDWEEIPLSMAQRGDYIGLKVRGASMEPRFLEGDTVIVRRQPDVESGEIAIVLVNGDEATMKRVHKSAGGLTLVALNPTVYEPHFYSNRQIAELPVTIYGRVVELRGKM